MNTCITCVIREFLAFTTAGTFPAEGVRVDYDCDTIVLEDCFVLSCTTTGFKWMQTAGTTGPRLCRAVNCYSESNTLDGFEINAGRDVRLIGCHAAVNSRHGFLLSGGSSIVLATGFALQNNQFGILVTGGAAVKIFGNTCSNNSQQTSVTYDGIRIENNVVGAEVAHNRSGDFVFTLTNKQRYGVSIGATGTDFIQVVGNDLQTNTTGALGNFSTGANNIITRNIGVAPAGVAAIAVTASPFTYTNVDGVPEAVYISAGTITNITKNAIQIFGATTGETVWLEPNEAITVTYTVAPTMNKDRK